MAGPSRGQLVRKKKYRKKKLTSNEKKKLGKKNRKDTVQLSVQLFATTVMCFRATVLDFLCNCLN